MNKKYLLARIKGKTPKHTIRQMQAIAYASMILNLSLFATVIYLLAVISK